MSGKCVKVDHLSVGRIGEDLACRHLKKQGYIILDRNFRTRQGEIDIIAEQGDTVTFVEVKARQGRACGHPLEAVTPAKCRQISKVALQYIAENGLENRAARFDVVAVTLETGKEPELLIVQNAFDLSYGV